MPLPEVDKIWMNGELVPWAEAKVHVLTHALHYGSGVFEGIRCYKTPAGPAVFRLEEHLKRLIRSAKLYYMPVPYSLEQLYDATFAVIAANGLEACYVRPLVFRGYGEMGLFPLNAPVETIDRRLAVGRLSRRRRHRARHPRQGLEHPVARPPSLARAAKATGQYLNSILAKVEVTNAGYDEAIMLTEHGHVAEGSGENIFVVRGGMLMTPPPSDGVLEGITRDSVMQIARAEGIEVRERTITRSDLVIADELFFTGTAAEIVPIREVDDHVIGEPGPVTRRSRRSSAPSSRVATSDFGHFMEYARS